jgi:hypothetical protein
VAARNFTEALIVPLVTGKITGKNRRAARLSIEKGDPYQLLGTDYRAGEQRNYSCLSGN